MYVVVEPTEVPLNVGPEADVPGEVVALVSVLLRQFSLSRGALQLLGLVRHRQVFGRVVKTTAGTGIQKVLQ